MAETKVIIISEVLAKDLAGKEFDKDCCFNPVQDADGNWVISEQEANLMKLEFTSKKTSLKQTAFTTLKQSPQITYKTPITVLPWDKLGK